MRFNALPSEASPEWGQPETARYTNRLLFRSNRVNALTLLGLGCWYDAQERYSFVWSSRLQELARWMTTKNKSESTLLLGRSGDWTRAIARKTWSRCRTRGFGKYFAETVTANASSSSDGKGNTWRFIASLAKDLTIPSQDNRNRLRGLEAASFARFRTSAYGCSTCSFGETKVS
jgi:hypothetical protein